MDHRAPSPQRSPLGPDRRPGHCRSEHEWCLVRQQRDRHRPPAPAHDRRPGVDDRADADPHGCRDPRSDRGADIPPRRAPTSTPTSAPTSHPTSAPTTAPTSAPTAAPPGGAIAVPSSIDATGATDASAKLNAFLATVPDGSTIAFKPGATYLMDAPLKFSRRHNLTFDGQGATLKANGPTTESGSLIWVGSYGGANTGITIHDFKLVGHSPTPGVYQGGKEGAHGVLIAGSNDVERLRRNRQRRLGRLLLRRGLGGHRPVPRLDLPVERSQRSHDHVGQERHDPARRVPEERLRGPRYRAEPEQRRGFEHQVPRTTPPGPGATRSSRRWARPGRSSTA